MLAVGTSVVLVEIQSDRESSDEEICYGETFKNFSLLFLTQYEIHMKVYICQLL